MADGYAMLIPAIQDTHLRYAASCALSMNVPTQDAGMTIANTFYAFKDYKQIQAIYEGSACNLEGDTMILNFIQNCRDAVYIQYCYDSEKNNPSNNHKWKPDQFTNSLRNSL